MASLGNQDNFRRYNKNVGSKENLKEPSSLEDPAEETPGLKRREHQKIQSKPNFKFSLINLLNRVVRGFMGHLASHGLVAYSFSE